MAPQTILTFIFLEQFRNVYWARHAQKNSGRESKWQDHNHYHRHRRSHGSHQHDRWYRSGAEVREKPATPTVFSASAGPS
ncbi:hypothetical protein GGI11_005528 [Coemansia sp. RSA 2049]|nr:hypothetical protein GGI11_005528 [Coemansia sp. RSA 2049]